MLDGRYICEECRVFFDQEPVWIDEDSMCSMICAQKWSYKLQKEQLPSWTPRSVVDRIVHRIRQDYAFVLQLRCKLKRNNHMLLFRTHDLEELCTLLSSSQNWQETLLAGVESVPNTQTEPVLAFYCIKTKRLYFVSLE